MHYFLIYIAFLMSPQVSFSSDKCWNRRPCDCKQKWWCEAYKKRTKNVDPPKLYQLAFNPIFLSPDKNITIQASLHTAGDFDRKPRNINVYRVNTHKKVASLIDNGISPDLAANDYTYSGPMKVITQSRKHGECLSYVAKLENLSSPPSKICFSNFLEAPKGKKIYEIIGTKGNSYDGGSLILYFKKNTKSKQISSIEKKYNGVVVQLISMNTFVFYPKTSLKIFKELLMLSKRLESEAIIESVEVNQIVSVD